MNILITGGAGYVGSVMSRRLLEEGHNVIVLDNLSHGNKDSIPEGVTKFINGSIHEFGTLVTKDDHVDAVIHLAGLIAAGESMNVPEIYWDNNVIGTLRMLDGMRDLGIKKIVFASSAAVYGDPEVIPITEDSKKDPTNTYGMTKLAMDMAITSECFAHGLAAASLRFFNVAGAYKDAGERHPVETHIIPILLDVAAGKRESFTLFGDDYETLDGTCVRDYIHVVDLANAAILALDKINEGKHSIYNLGSGTGFSNKQLVNVVRDVTGKDIKVNYADRRAGDPATLVASSERAMSELGWRPSRPGIKDIISDAWQFYNSQT